MNSKKRKQKDSIRYFKEKAKRCGDCKKLFNGQCLHAGRRYKNEIACVEFANGGL